MLQRRTKGDFACLDDVAHPAQRLLKFYKSRGAPVRFKSEPWSAERVDKALQQGLVHGTPGVPPRGVQGHVGQGTQWVVLPASEVIHLPGLRISLPGLVPQRDRHPRWIVDYTCSEVNQETLPLAAVEAMQFGHALDRLLQEIMLSNPAFDPVKLMKVDMSNGLYQVSLKIENNPKLGVVFLTQLSKEQLIAFIRCVVREELGSSRLAVLPLVRASACPGR